MREKERFERTIVELLNFVPLVVTKKDVFHRENLTRLRFECTEKTFSLFLFAAATRGEESPLRNLEFYFTSETMSISSLRRLRIGCIATQNQIHICDTCNLPNSVEHVLINCSKHEDKRRRHNLRTHCTNVAKREKKSWNF